MNDSTTDQLIAHVIDGTADEAVWLELTRRAADDPAVWRDLVETQRDESSLTRLMETAGAVADTVEAPVGVIACPAPRASLTPRAARDAGHPAWTGPLVARWTGWAVAAVVFLAWTVTALRTSPAPATPRSPGHVAGVIPVSTAQEALAAYLEKGRAEDTVIREVPGRVLLETRRRPDGAGYEVIYLRQLMERRVVPHLYRIEGQDERGRPSLARYDARLDGRM